MSHKVLVQISVIYRQQLDIDLKCRL